MKKKFTEIKGYLKIEKFRHDKRVVVFLVCLLIATTLWFLNALSKDYTTILAYPVKYINPPENQFLANQPPLKLELKVSAHGFTLLRHKLSFSFSPIILNLTNITYGIEPSANGYRVNTSALTRKISDQVSSEISVINIQPELFYIKLDSLKTKLVPIKTNLQIDFKPQYNLKEPVTTSPKQVEITGPAALIDTIYFLSTEKIVIDKLEASLIKNITISHPEKTTIKPEKTELKIAVEKFTEKEITIPVQIINKPDSINIKLFPSEIKLAIMVGLSEFDRIDASKFKVSADYNDVTTDTENLKITVESEIPNIQIVRYTPTNIEYLIETN